jgi:hypothetical protein
MSKNKRINRRSFLRKTSRTVAAGLAVGSFSSLVRQRVYGEDSDESERYDFLMARVRFYTPEDVKDVREDWASSPGADRNLLERLSSVVRCKVKLPPNCGDVNPSTGAEYQFNAVVDFRDIENLRKFPFVFMTGWHLYSFSASEKRNLKKYVLGGGFLLMDECTTTDKFYKCSYALLEKIFGRGAVERIPNSHEIFHNVYDLTDTGLPHCHGISHGARGVFVGDRLAVFLSSVDIHCAWAKHPATRYWEEALQMGVNIIMYAISH